LHTASDTDNAAARQDFDQLGQCILVGLWITMQNILTMCITCYCNCTKSRRKHPTIVTRFALEMVFSEPQLAELLV